MFKSSFVILILLALMASCHNKYGLLKRRYNRGFHFISPGPANIPVASKVRRRIPDKSKGLTHQNYLKAEIVAEIPAAEAVAKNQAPDSKYPGSQKLNQPLNKYRESSLVKTPVQSFPATFQKKPAGKKNLNSKAGAINVVRNIIIILLAVILLAVLLYIVMLHYAGMGGTIAVFVLTIYAIGLIVLIIFVWLIALILNTFL